jgi:hypothetical protein
MKPFDAIVGDGTISASDERIEICNATALTASLSDWMLETDEGTPETENFSTSSAVFRFSPGCSLAGLLPGGYIIIGNPQGYMSNTLTLSLRNGTASLVDEIYIEDGNSSNVSDEAEARNPDGSPTWVRQSATLDTSDN